MKTSARSAAHRSSTGSLTDDSVNFSTHDGDGVTTSPPQSPTSDKEVQGSLDQLSMLFGIEEEKCPPGIVPGRRHSRLSKGGVPRSDLAKASFIYQRIDFGVLGKCVPPFVRAHLNRNGRYLPETFILRVNYLRRRKQLGDDSTVKRPTKEPTSRTCNEAGPSPTPRITVAKS
ncbi:hypothetical protein C0Q70_09098 [Pomacea canaliculata]|uniref:Uncharacterized protein n=1 Tax=Pomacea canaliculata TaxID=400727 RepID=A0A2T7P8V7_POMCA|nr:hypothetical protein C0Q70_09098 [Pomacea canaliculata]